MAKHCMKCDDFKGQIVTCKGCGLPVCPECSAVNYYCKDCYIERENEIVIGAKT